MAVNVVSFLFFWCSTGGPEATLLGDGFLYDILSASSPDPNSSGPTFRLQLSGTQLPTAFCSIRRPHITFKPPRGDMDTPPCLRNFFRYLAIGMCHFRYLWNSLCDRHRKEITHSVHRSLSSGASLWSGTFTLSHIIRRAHLRDSFRLLVIGMCHFLPVHHFGIAFLGRVEGQNTTHKWVFAYEPSTIKKENNVGWRYTQWVCWRISYSSIITAKSLSA